MGGFSREAGVRVVVPYGSRIAVRIGRTIKRAIERKRLEQFSRLEGKGGRARLMERRV
jgi:hypothetical protein